MAQRFDFYLNNVGFYLDRTERQGAYLKTPQEAYVGASKDSFWQAWALRSFHGGERMQRVLDAEDVAAYRYYTASGLDLATWGEAKLLPALQRQVARDTTTCPMCLNYTGDTILVGLDTAPWIKKFSGGVWSDAAAVAGAGAVTDLYSYGAYLYAVRGGTCLRSTDGGANWVALPGTAHADAVCIRGITDHICVLKTSGVYNQTDSAVISATGGRAMVAHKEDLYWSADRRLFRWNGNAWWLTHEFPAGFNVLELASYRTVLFALGYFKEQGGYKGAVYSILQGGECHLYSVGDYAENHQMQAMAGSDDEIFFANNDTGGVDRYDLTNGGLQCGPALGAFAVIPRAGVCYGDGYLVLAKTASSAAGGGIYVANLCNPTAYVTAGELVTADYDFDFPNDVKVLRRLEVHHKALAAGQSIALSYSTNGGVSWTLAGTSNTLGATSKRFEFTNVEFQSLMLKHSFVGPGTSTPTWRKTLALAAAVSEAKWEWTLLASADKVASRSGRPAKGFDRLTSLETAHATRLPVTYVDRLGTTHTVVIEDFTERAQARSRQRMKLQIKLREV